MCRQRLDKIVIKQRNNEHTRTHKIYEEEIAFARVSIKWRFMKHTEEKQQSKFRFFIVIVVVVYSLLDKFASSTFQFFFVFFFYKISIIFFERIKMDGRCHRKRVTKNTIRKHVKHV